MASPLSLAEAKKEIGGQTYTLEDFATDEEIEQIEQAVKSPSHRRFDAAAQVSAEVLARFGFEAWQAWQVGEITIEEMNAYLAAERGRDRELLVEVEAALGNLIKSTIHREKNKGVPKGVRASDKIVKNQQRIIEGKI